MTISTTTAMEQRAVSEQIVEFLLAEIALYAGKSCQTIPSTTTAGPTTTGQPTATTVDEEESMTVAAEMAAAKLERMGAAVGYRLTERLAEHKSWNAIATSTINSNNQPPDIATMVAAQQLEAVKFLCKEVWMELFDKQMDKLQTNHRGVFVLKDFELKWLMQFPVGSEQSRVMADS
jgi:trafficking protein particle complex subunit 6